MIKPTQLRIGNVFPSLTGDEFVPVKELSASMANIGGSWIPYSALFGVPLTPELFDRIGFEKHESPYVIN